MGEYRFLEMENKIKKSPSYPRTVVVNNPNYFMKNLPSAYPQLQILGLSNSKGTHLDILVKRLENENNHEWKFSRQLRILQLISECDAMGTPLSKEDMKVYAEYAGEKSEALKNVVLSTISEDSKLVYRDGEDNYHLTEDGEELLDTAKIDLFGRNFRFVDDMYSLRECYNPRKIYFEVLGREVIFSPILFAKKVKDCVGVIAERKYGVTGLKGRAGVVRYNTNGRVELLYGNARKVLVVNNRLTPVGMRVLEVLEEKEVEKYPELTDFLRVAGVLNRVGRPTQLGEDLYRMLKRTIERQHDSPKISTYRNQ